MNIRRELEKLKFIPIPKIFIDPTCNANDQAKMKEIIAKLGGQIAASAGKGGWEHILDYSFRHFSFDLTVRR
jgi:hypothetical protein